MDNLFQSSTRRLPLRVVTEDESRQLTAVDVPGEINNCSAERCAQLILNFWDSQRDVPKSVGVHQQHRIALCNPPRYAALS